MKEITREDIALFRYNQIYPVLKKTYSEKTQHEYLKKNAQKLVEYPDGTKRYIQPSTVREWVRYYQKSGFDGLKPKQREDRGIARSLTADQKLEILRLKEENPRRTAASIRRMMIHRGDFIHGACSESTIQRFLKKNKMNLKKAQEDMRAFEMSHVNELWQIDTSHGPFLTIGDTKKKTYIVAIVDDATRFVVGIDIYYEDNALNVQQTLKKAINTYGVPDRLYADNGKPYKNRQLALICANLGVGLVHAAPYHGNAKGKVERFFGVMKTNWMYNINYVDFDSLEKLRESLASYVQEKNRTYHRTLNQTPFDRFTQDNRQLKKVASEKLEKAFLHSATRKVANDGIIKLHNKEFEVGYLSIGLTLFIRYLPDFSKVYHETEDGRLIQLKEVNRIDNAKIKRNQIRLTEA